MYLDYNKQRLPIRALPSCPDYLADVSDKKSASLLSKSQRGLMLRASTTNVAELLKKMHHIV